MNLDLGLNDGPEWIPGINNNIILLITAVVIVAWLFTNRIEKFTASMFATDDEYIREVRNVASYVGPYIGEIYLYLRNKYHISIPMFKPGGVNDPTLADPLLPIARTQIKSWIDSSKLRIKQKYGEAMLARLQPQYDIAYTQGDNGVLQVVNTNKATSTTYVV